MSGQIEAAVLQVHIIGEFVQGFLLFIIPRPERPDLPLNYQGAHSPHQPGRPLLRLFIPGIVLQHPVQRRKNIAHFVKRTMVRMRPRIRLMKPQAVLPQDFMRWR